jgi:hypothetical protein
VSSFSQIWWIFLALGFFRFVTGRCLTNKLV